MVPHLGKFPIKARGSRIHHGFLGDPQSEPGQLIIYGVSVRTGQKGPFSEPHGLFRRSRRSGGAVPAVLADGAVLGGRCTRVYTRVHNPGVYRVPIHQ